MNLSELEIRIIKVIIEPMRDGVYIADKEGFYVIANTAFERITGINRDELTGRHTNLLLEKRWITEVVNMDVLREQMCITKVITYPSGRPILVTADLITKKNGEVCGVLSCLRDVTELSELQNQLTKSELLIRQFKKRLDFLEDKIHVDGESYVAQSTELRKVLCFAKKVAHSDATVLITGASGTGKEFIARYIHKCSKRSETGAFIKVDCAALPANLLETELFGYEKGAYTDARIEGKPGMFEIANNGTLFLDEVAEIPLELQAKLLISLQDREIKRVGGIKTIPVNIRIICATNRHLKNMVQERKFREDLYYRLNVVPIHIDPLKERREDILPLIKNFLTFFNDEYKLKKIMSPDLLHAFVNYDWPGNTRELKNMVERLVVTSSGDMITSRDLHNEAITANSEAFVSQRANPITLQETGSLKKLLSVYEKQVIEQALRVHGNLEDAANALQVSLPTLVRKNRKYNLTGHTRNSKEIERTSYLSVLG